MFTLGRLLKRTHRINLDLNKAGVTVRSRNEQMFHRYKVDFFKTWSPEMAWVLGLLYTDGNLSGRTVKLASIDADLLSSVGALLFKRFQIREYLQADGRNRISTLGIHHPEMVSDLRLLGLEERKSLTMRFPNIPHEYVRHFIRGCWDGDGGFSISSGKLSGHYTCGSLGFIQRITQELFKVGISRRILHFDKSLSRKDAIQERERLRSTYGPQGPYPLWISKRKNSNAYDIRLNGYAQLAPLFDYLYRGVTPDIRLQRKYDLISSNIEYLRPALSSRRER